MRSKQNAPINNAGDDDGEDNVPGGDDGGNNADGDGNGEHDFAKENARSRQKGWKMFTGFPLPTLIVLMVFLNVVAPTLG